MNKQFLTRTTEAHSWLGLIISGLLFVIFFAGSVSLFRDEIQHWSMQPHFEVTQGNTLPVSRILEIAIANRPFDAKEHLTLIKPSDHVPYYQAYIDIEHQVGERDYDAIYIDPISGEIIAEIDSFQLAEFIYHLHYNLNFSAGKWIMGFVTLFFFFAVISGIVLHAKKLFTNFFKYRSQSTKRSQLLDMHTVIGVMSLPLTVMYAITGLIFNMVLIYQIAFAVVLYQGDQQALLDDAGYQEVSPKWRDIPWQQNNIDQLIQQTTTHYGSSPKMVRVYNYGDESAVLHLNGAEQGKFAQKYELAYQLNDQSSLFIKDSANPNTLVQGLHIFSRLHFGDFAGVDLRLIYFVLGLAVCALIVTGNLLWLAQKAKKKAYSIRTMNFVHNFTLVSTAGVIFATCVSFIVERLLPINMALRADYMIYSFIASLALTAILLIFKPNKQVYLAWLLKLSGILLFSLVIIDYFMFAATYTYLWQLNVVTSFAVQIGFIIIGSLLFYIGARLLKQQKVNITSPEQQAVLLN